MLVEEVLKKEILKQLICWAFKLSSEECQAWKDNSAQFKKRSQKSSALGVIPNVLDHFTRLFAYSEQQNRLSFLSDCSVSSNVSSKFMFRNTSFLQISAVIWTEKSLEAFLQEQTKQFLQLSVLLKSQLLQKSIVMDAETSVNFGKERIRKSESESNSLLAYFNISQVYLLDIPIDDSVIVISRLFRPFMQRHQAQVMNIEDAKVRNFNKVVEKNRCQ